MKIYKGNVDFSNAVEVNINKLLDYLKKLNYDDSFSIYIGYPIVNLDNQKTVMKACIVSKKGLIAIYDTDKEKSDYNRFMIGNFMSDEHISSIYLNNNDLLKFAKIESLDKIKGYLEENDILNLEEVDALHSMLQKIYGLTVPDKRIIENTNSYGSLIKARSEKINYFDNNQFNSVYKEIRSHLRIRGLAGSGKTILLVKKMAYMHYKNPSLELAYVFFTKSLKQYITELFMKFYKDFDKYSEPNMEKIHIIHSWGGKNIDGFYSKVCDINGFPKKTLNDARRDYRDEKDIFGALCSEVLQHNSIVPMYDYVFVDEAQDFSLPFFKLVLKTLNYTGKMIYAYDELQSLNDNGIMPSKEEIFSNHDDCEDINLDVCYRTPKEILVTAHALGLGIYRKTLDGKPGIINMMQDCGVWKAVGYRVNSGQLKYGADVELDRDEYIKFKPNDCIVIESVKNEYEQYKFVCNEINRLLKEEDIVPEDILVIDLDSRSLNENFACCREVLHNVNSEHKMHLVNTDNAIKFRVAGSVPYTTIFRAKGNEANIVFVLNVHNKSSMLTYSRNRLFTAFTRAKFKVYALGIEGETLESIINEYNDIAKAGYKLQFKYPTEQELQNMRIISQKEVEDASKFDKAIRTLGGNTELTLGILKEQLKVESIDDLIAKIKEMQNGK